MTTFDELLNGIFDGKAPSFYAEFEGWLRGSRRFRAFATSYQGKICSKLKNVRDEGGMNDLRAELETAALLLREERFTLEYEKYAASKQRGPDFTVTFRTHTPFNVEVRRIRKIELDGEDREVRTSKLMRVLCDKVGQMPPRIVNILWVIAESEISEPDLIHALTTLRQLAEHKVEDFFTRRGFKSANDFLKHYQQLSGIFVRQSVKKAPGEDVFWLNPLARHKALPEIVMAIQRLLMA